MQKTIINTPNAPAPIGPYSQAVQAGDWLFISGQIAINPTTGLLNFKNIHEEATQVMENLKAILQRFIRGDAGDASSSTDPKNSSSLKALFQSLPAEIQNLLRRAFPNADQLMDADATAKALKAAARY